MNEQSKAAKRRFSDGAFHTRYFVGNGVDIGGRPDPLGQYAHIFGRMESVSVWDIEDGDAQKMEGVADGSFDFVHSSHCLEHMNDVSEAMKNWVRIVKPGGFLIITVPDEDLYENGQWPSRYNSDHKWSFTIRKNNSKLPRSINVTDLLAEFNHLVEIERIVLVRDFFQDSFAGKVDQTLTPVAECAIEFVLRKRDVPETVGSQRFPSQITLPQTTPLCQNGFNAMKQARHGWMLYNVNDTNLGAIIDTYGEFSEGEVALFQHYVKTGAVVIECGANIGSLTLPLSKMVGVTGKVIAFEPQHTLFQTLCANMALNSVNNVICRNQAVGDVNGNLLVPPLDPFTRQSPGSICLEGFTQGESVQQITIDSLELSECHFIKVDVEGMEEKTLRGARQTIDRCKPVLYVENDREEKSASLEAYIRELGYEIFPHRPLIAQEDNFFGTPLSIFKDYVSLNLLCTPICAGTELPLFDKGSTITLENNFNPARPQPTQSTGELYKEAVSLVDSNKLDEAIQVLEALVIQAPDNALAHNDLGVVYQRMGDLQKSRQHHESASQLQPENSTFQKNLADLLCTAFGELEEALTIYVKLFAENSYDIETMKAIAHICLEVDKPDDARFFLEKILEIKPWDQEAAEALRALKASL